MLRRFFRYLDDKNQRRESKKQDDAERVIESDPISGPPTWLAVLVGACFGALVGILLGRII